MVGDYGDMATNDSARTRTICPAGSYADCAHVIPITQRPVSIVGGALGTTAKQQSEDFYELSGQDDGRYSEGNSFMTFPTQRISGVAGAVMDRKLGQLAKTFRSLQIKGRMDASPRSKSDTSVGLPAIKYTVGKPSDRANYSKIALQNQKISKKLSEIYSKPVVKVSQPVRIRSKFEIAETERLRCVMLENEVRKSG